LSASWAGLAGAIETPLGTIVLASARGRPEPLVGLINERGVPLVVHSICWRSWTSPWSPARRVFGHGGVVAALFIAVLPYAFDQGQAVGDFLVAGDVVAYLVGSMAARPLNPGSPGLDSIGTSKRSCLSSSPWR